LHAGHRCTSSPDLLNKADSLSRMALASLRFEVGAASHTGLVRERNEDSALTTSGLFAVADGMGGHAAGDVASRLAVAAFMRLAGRDALRSRDILDAVAAANDDILNAIDEDGQRAGMGTTLTGIAIVAGDPGPRWAVFNVGDSRVYRFFDDTLTQVTEDHSEVGELVAAGQLTAEQAAVYPRRNVITRSLGTVPAPHPDIWLLEPEAPERFVICSDGLTTELSDDEIAAVLRAEPEPQRAADRLVTEAVGAGGRDNVTVLVIDSN
jgi:PPM family protein phosphatase